VLNFKETSSTTTTFGHNELECRLLLENTTKCMLIICPRTLLCWRIMPKVLFVHIALSVMFIHIASSLL